MRDFETLNKLSRGNFTYAKFVKLKDLAKNTIGESNDIFEIELSSILNLYKNIDDNIIELDKQISTIIKELNPDVNPKQETSIKKNLKKIKGERSEFIQTLDFYYVIIIIFAIKLAFIAYLPRLKPN